MKINTILIFVSLISSIFSQEIFFTEEFEDMNFSARGWYDNVNLTLTDTVEFPESTHCAEFHFPLGATVPTSGSSIRHLFTPTDSVYVSFYIKYSSNWEGSNRTYHPHEFYLLTTEDAAWTGPAYSHLTTYIEQNEGEPMIQIQDGENIDEANIGVDLTNVTEVRAVAGCNGDSDGYGDGNCYEGGGVYRNEKRWRAGSIFFTDTLGPYYKNEWHLIEVFFKLNSIDDEIGIPDGLFKYWYDGELIMDKPGIMFRTGQHSNMQFNQFLIGPYIGVGSPVDQTFWVDNLIVGRAKPQGQLEKPAILKVSK